MSHQAVPLEYLNQIRIWHDILPVKLFQWSFKNRINPGFKMSTLSCCPSQLGHHSKCLFDANGEKIIKPGEMAFAQDTQPPPPQMVGRIRWMWLRWKLLPFESQLPSTQKCSGMYHTDRSLKGWSRSPKGSLALFSKAWVWGMLVKVHRNNLHEGQRVKVNINCEHHHSWIIEVLPIYFFIQFWPNEASPSVMQYFGLVFNPSFNVIVWPSQVLTNTETKYSLQSLTRKPS